MPSLTPAPQPAPQRRGAIRTRTLVREFLAGRSMLGLAIKYRMPLLVVEERIRQWSRRHRGA